VVGLTWKCGLDLLDCDAMPGGVQFDSRDESSPDGVEDYFWAKG